MSPSQARPRTLYVLIFCNVFVLLLTLTALGYAQTLSDRLAKTEQRNYAGCVRGNVLREGYRFAMVQLGSPERANTPEVQPQPCAEIYPGGVPSNRKGEP